MTWKIRNGLSVLRTTFMLATVCVGPTSLFAGAVSISTLYSTGKAASQAVDPNYTIISTPTGGSGSAFVTDSANFPFPSWYGNSVSSSWISPTSSYAGSGGDAAGTYIYQTTFNLTGLDPSSASITLSVAADNSISQLILNGNVIPFSYSSFMAMSDPTMISGGFLSGVNTLDFVTYNGDGPGGLRVDAFGTADVVSSTPEPSTMLLATIMLMGTGLYRLRRTQN